MTIAFERTYEPDGLDLLSLAPFVASQSFAAVAIPKLRSSLWHGLWVVPLSGLINSAASVLLLVASLINATAAAILSCKAAVWSAHHFTTAHDTFLYAGVSLIRIFYPVFAPL